jgi:hypothetical protein
MMDMPTSPPPVSLLRRVLWWLRGGRARHKAAQARRAFARAARAPSIAATPELRSAVHEAGHAVALWCCTATEAIRSVHIDAAGGGVLHDTRERSQAERWCCLVICLAGVAAEGAAFGSWRSGEAKRDLLRARELAEQLGETPAPWTVGPTYGVIEKPFRALSEGATRALHVGYAMPQRVLRAHCPRFYRLVGSLLHLRHLDRSALAAVLGSRVPIRFFGLCGRADFILDRP